MPTFELTGPDGASYELDAPDERAALSAFRGFSGGQQKQAPPSTAYDVAQSLPAGVARGVAGIVGLPGAAQEGMSFLARQTAGRIRNYATKGTFDAPSAEETAARDEAIRAAGPFNISLPTPQGVTNLIESTYGGKLYEPQTTAGKFANVAGEFAAGGLTPGSVGQRVARVAVPTVTSEGSGQIADQIAPEYGTAARVVGGLVGGVGTALAEVPRGANALTAEALQSARITQGELRQAYALIDDAARRPDPVRLTLDEALNQVTNGRAARLSQIRRVAENSGGEGAAPLADITAGRAQEVRAAARGETDRIAPNPYPADQAAQRAQDAAEGALGDLRAYRTDQVREPYARAANDVVPEADMRAVIAGIDQDIAANANNPELVAGLRDLRARLIEEPGQAAVPSVPGTRTPVMGPNGQIIRYETRPGTPEIPAVPERPYTNVGELDAVAKATRDAYGTADTAAIGISATERQAGRLTNRGVGSLNDTLVANSPDLAAGRRRYADITESVVTPAEQGPLGSIAQRIAPESEGASANMGRALAGAGQGDRYDAVVQQAARRLVRQDPRAAQTIARDYIADKFERAMADLQAGGNPNAGAAARKSLYGNEADRNNIRAMLTQLPGGQARATAFDRLMEIFEATGYRPPKGSDTAFNQAIQQDARQASGAVGQAVGTAVQGGLNLKRALSDRVARYRLGNNMSEIASILTEPAARPLLEQLAGTPVGSNRALGLALRLTFLGEQAASGSRSAQPVP
ncbi:hypothetical protein J2X36_002151 [Methylobacterium sp. BE186]|uniref:hypothetical protein n=1 Tax=Methylobacterium sp. BE186 TaxID=2817715 RepID=UPI002859E4DD|nr:hypothetical protein [Methylobacterium sp. BE186]MDR7037404.1 hypothetical protein [Methylobacterium sp. BE186]